MDAQKADVNNIFNRNRRLEIPHFQRSYVWENSQWERFLDDMKYISTGNSPYFLGSVILKQKETPSSDTTGDVRCIIDGQQRLTTITLFFKALYEINGNPEKFFEIFKTHGGDLILLHNHIDKELFEKIILTEGGHSELTIEDNDKEQLIYKCYKYFLDNIKQNEIEANTLLRKLQVVLIDIGSQEDEQQIFDTINSLGVSLTTAELMKNFLFKIDDIAAYTENWKNVFEKKGETKDYWEQEVTTGRNKRNNVDIFLESYLKIKIQEKEFKVSSEDKKRYFKINSVFSSYKEFIKKYDINKDEIIKEIKDYAKIYRENINPEIVVQDIDKDDYVGRINLIIFALDTATIIPYLLYICKQVQDSDEKKNILKYLETYLMRRVIAKETTKNYNQLFGTSVFTNEVNTLDKLKDIIRKKEDAVNLMPTDRDLENGFYESVLTNKQSTGVLYLIEKTIRNDMNSTELRDIKEYSLEHVMPKKWTNKWDNNLTPEQQEKRDDILLTLGNLTIITKRLNSSIRDADWETKKRGSGKHKGLNAYAIGIEIFSDYLSETVWNEECIKKRAKKLYDYSVNQVWKL